MKPRFEHSRLIDDLSRAEIRGHSVRKVTSGLKFEIREIIRGGEIGGEEMREARDEIKLKFHGDKSGGAVRRDAILRAPDRIQLWRERGRGRKNLRCSPSQKRVCTAKFGRIIFSRRREELVGEKMISSKRVLLPATPSLMDGGRVNKKGTVVSIIWPATNIRRFNSCKFSREKKCAWGNFV